MTMRDDSDRVLGAEALRILGGPGSGPHPSDRAKWEKSGTVEQVGDYPPTFEHKLDGGWSVGWSKQDDKEVAFKAHPTGTRDYKYFDSKKAAYNFAAKRPWREVP